ncbi:MAG: hypothetical protein ACLR1V_08520 [Coprococcus sp.]
MTAEVHRSWRQDDRIEIYKAQETTQLIRLKGRSFYQVLQNKIGTA